MTYWSKYTEKPWKTRKTMAKNFDGFIVLYQVAKCYYYHGISNTGFRRGGGDQYEFIASVEEGTARDRI